MEEEKPSPPALPDKPFKKITIYISDLAHAELRMRFRYDSIKQTTFFKKMIEYYMNDNEIMRDLIKAVNLKKISKRSLKKMARDEKEAKKVKETFGLDEAEIKDIYDILERQESGNE